jgi:hypothetical protein
MIQFNLLPDVKLDYIRARRTKRMLSLVSVVVAGACLAVVIFLAFVVYGLQATHLSDLNRDIKTKSRELKDIPNLDKILTVQNQLSALPALHDKKPVVTRTTTYLKQVVPVEVLLAQLDIDFAANTMHFSGKADNLVTVNKFVDTLKFTDFQAGETSARAFSEVVLTTFSRDDKGAGFEVTLKFEPTIYSSQDEVTLIVPKITTTRSETEKPTELFQSTPVRGTP